MTSRQLTVLPLKMYSTASQKKRTTRTNKSSHEQPFINKGSPLFDRKRKKRTKTETYLAKCTWKTLSVHSCIKNILRMNLPTVFVLWRQYYPFIIGSQLLVRSICDVKRRD
ncbi:hypothetical protein M514_03240, partial [Trichuris suis]